MPGELIKNSIMYVVVNSLAKGLTFLIWIVLGWWLAPSKIGLYALVMFIIQFFSTISIFGLGSVIRWYINDGEIQKISL